MTFSKTKVRRAATRGLSVGLTATTSLWLAGSSMFLAVPAAHALGNEVVVADITGTNPRIAQDGESERVFLGLNVASSAGTSDTVHLQAIQANLNAVDTSLAGDEREATNANVETVRIYQDSSLSGTNGVFDSNDAKLDMNGDESGTEITRNTAGTGTADTDLADQAQALASAVASTGELTANQTTKFCVAGATADLAVGDAVAILDLSATTTYQRVVTVASLALGGAVDGCAIARDLYTVDTAMAGRTADAVGDTIQDNTAAAPYPVGITAINVALATNLAATDTVKIGTGATAEVRLGSALVSTVLTITATTYAHTNTDLVKETNAQAVDGAGNGFRAFGTNTTEVELGDPGDQAAETANSGYEIPRTDSGTEAGDDLFVVLITKGGVADAQIKVQVDASGDVEYNNETSNVIVSPSVTSATGTASGETKAVTFGADGIDPTISKIESVDNDNDGRVDRFKVYFSESMASGETDADNFVDAQAGTESSVEVGATDMTLEDLGEWSTTTMLNDTFTMDVTNQSAYTNNQLSTGDTYTLIYDKDKDTANQFKDSTGEALEDASKTSVDKALPVVDPTDITNSVTLHDLDGDGKIDQMRVTASESLGSGSTAAGFTLTNTTAEPDKVMALSAVAGFMKSSGANANDNDTIKISVTEASATDVNDTFTLAYAAQTSGGILDVAGNAAPADSSVSNAKGVNPVVEKIEVRDTDNNGKINRVDVFFSCSITEVGQGEDDFTVSGYAMTGDVGAVSGKEFQITIDEGAVNDTGVVPDVTYTDDGEIATDGLHCGDTTFAMQALSSGAIVEVDKAQPKIVSATLYESTNDNIWKSGETLQILYTENVDPATIAASWDVSSGDGTAFVDWRLESANNTTTLDALIPDKGTVAVSGKVVTLTASVDATSALATSHRITNEPNEVKDAATNSGFPEWDATAWATDSVALVVDPTAAPVVDEVRTWDTNANGVLDALSLHFDGLVNSATLAAADFAAARGANFTIADAATEAASSTTAVSPDLVINSVATLSGGNDSVVLVKFNEASEDTSRHPQVKYVQGGLKDLAANKVASFNNNSADNAKFETTISEDSQDFAAPVVKHKRLKDRNANGKYDQLVLVFSEGIDNDATATNVLANGSHNSTGWAVSGQSLASSGDLRDNTGAYDMYTFATTNAVFQVDILEDGAPTTLPSVTYTSQGNFKDKWQNTVLANVLAGGEVSDLVVAPAPAAHMSGDLLKGSGPSIWVVKHVGAKLFKRHVLSDQMGAWYPHLSPFWSKIITVDDATINSHILSAWVRVAGTAAVYEINDDRSAHHLTCNDDAVAGQDCANEWTVAGGDPDGIYDINAAEWGYYIVANPVVLPDQPN